MTKSFFWFSFGILLFLLLGSMGPAVISPGGLADSHKFLNQKCESCHSAFESGAGDWVGAALTSRRRPDESRKCLGCHVLGENGRLSHGVAPTRLSEISKKIKKGEKEKHLAFRLASTLKLDRWPKPETALACSACHGDHRGTKASLKESSSRKCQACHTAVFEKFETDHPDFSSYPYTLRTRLIFDHVAHLKKHFKESEEIAEKAPSQCRSCHALDQSGRFMTVARFETVCASCHEPQILGKGSAGDKGIPFFSVPGLDREALKEANIDIGRWPKNSEVEELSPFMQLLLIPDPEFLAVRAKLGNLDFLDLSEAEKSRKEAVGKIAWSIKKLLFELATNGQQGLRMRIEDAIGRSLTEAELSKLTAQFPVDLVRTAQAAWFPGLGAELSRRERGERKNPPQPVREKRAPKTREESGKKTSAESASIVGGWYLQDFVLFYRPSGHQDRFLLGWLELTGAGPFPSTQANRPAIFEMLSKRKAPGMCAKCHSIDKTKEGGSRVNWTPKRPAMDIRAFTKFSHAPHFSLLDEKGCMTCHKLAEEADYEESYKGSDPKVFESNFGEISKTLCAKCHTDGRSSNQCLTCHNYHIGHVKPAAKEPSFSIAQSGGEVDSAGEQ